MKAAMTGSYFSRYTYNNRVIAQHKMYLSEDVVDIEIVLIAEPIGASRHVIDLG
jgi:hypothetical protein